ncbi:MAG TPA: hypothetical protein DC064_19465 [Cyanobacteria bacterium UBA9273]|nr:hypothetical protein [Cyanobacteria bacterium UBA9273]
MKVAWESNFIKKQHSIVAPLTPQLWGEPESQSPPGLGDLGGLGEPESQSPPGLGDLGGLGEPKSQSPPGLGDLGGIPRFMQEVY